MFNSKKTKKTNHGELRCYSCIAPTWNWPLGDSPTTQIRDCVKKNKIIISPPYSTASLNSTFYNPLAKCIIHIHTVQSETTQNHLGLNHLLKHWYKSPPLQKLFRLEFFLYRKQNNLWKKIDLFLKFTSNPIKILWYRRDTWHHVQIIIKIGFSTIFFFHYYSCVWFKLYI